MEKDRMDFLKNLFKKMYYSTFIETMIIKIFIWKALFFEIGYLWNKEKFSRFVTNWDNSTRLFAEITSGRAREMEEKEIFFEILWVIQKCKKLKKLLFSHG